MEQDFSYEGGFHKWLDEVIAVDSKTLSPSPRPRIEMLTELWVANGKSFLINGWDTVAEGDTCWKKGLRRDDAIQLALIHSYVQGVSDATYYSAGHLLNMAMLCSGARREVEWLDGEWGRHGGDVGWLNDMQSAASFETTVAYLAARRNMDSMVNVDHISKHVQWLASFGRHRDDIPEWYRRYVTSWNRHMVPQFSNVIGLTDVALYIKQ